MKNLFDIINDRIPKTEQPHAQSAEKRPESMDDVIRRYQSGGNTSDAEKILSFLTPTINSAINSYAPGSGNRFKVKAATLALNAIKTYDPARGVAPQTYVFHNLKRLNRLSAERGTVISVPEEQRLQYTKLTELARRFEDDHGREPSTTELADMSGMSEKRIAKIFSNNTVFSESMAVNEETGDTTFGVPGMSDMDYLKYVYADSSPVEQKIIEWSSGLHGKPILGTGEIASKLGLTPAAVSQRKNRLYAKLSDMRSLL